MGRTRLVNKAAKVSQVDTKQVKANSAKTTTADISETIDSDTIESMQNTDGDCHEIRPEIGLSAREETKTGKPTTARLKRKLPPQTQQSDSQVSKRQQSTTAVPSKESESKKSSCKKSSQDNREAGRYSTRCREKKNSQDQTKVVSMLDDVKMKSSPQSKANKKQTARSAVRASGKMSSSAVGSDGDVKRQIKPELKPENRALTTTRDINKLIGAHCSVAGGLHKAVEEAVAMGGRAFGLFLRSQRSWVSKPLDPVAAEKFKTACKVHGFPPNSILPHGSYLMNCGSPNPDTLQKSREALLDELQRCEALDLTLYNFHPGSTCGEVSVEECLDSIADAINWAHQHTKFVTTVIENMSCQGNTVGGRLEELKGIIDRVKDKSRIGVCLDTCHAFAAGFDLSTKQGYEQFVADFDNIVGFQYLKAIHLNDSKGDVGCHLDRHENIGKGKIGLEGFRRVMADPRFDGIPMILETPLGDYAKEINILYGLLKQ